MQVGFSKAAKYEKAMSFGSKKSSGYVVMDVETTGLDYDRDRIIEIGLLRINGNVVEKEFQCLVQSNLTLSDDITKLTGITNEMIASQGIGEKVAFDTVREFIGDSLVVGYNVQFDLNFLRKLGGRVGENIVITKIKDVMNISRRKLDGLKNYKLETVAEYFLLDVSNVHRALTDCRLTYEIYSELNKI